MREARGEGVAEVNGHAAENGDGEMVGKKVDIKIPEKAVREGGKAVRRELESVCEVVRED